MILKIVFFVKTLPLICLIFFRSVSHSCDNFEQEEDSDSQPVSVSFLKSQIGFN